MPTSSRGLKWEFASLIRDVDADIAPFIEAIDLAEIARHNAGYKAYAADKFGHFVEQEKRRYLATLTLIRDKLEHGSICDVGCFVPYLPVALSKLGYQVKIVDNYCLYGAKLKTSIERIAAKHGIQVFDLDILNDDFSALGKNDAVLLMAVVEHLNGSPRRLMEKIRNTISETGFLLFEVPNIAEFTRRVSALLGRSVLPDYAVYMESAYPFTGHNREMTVAEVQYLFEQTGYAIDSLSCYDYGNSAGNGWKAATLRVLKELAPIKNKRAAIRAVAHPRK